MINETHHKHTATTRSDCDAPKRRDSIYNTRQPANIAHNTKTTAFRTAIPESQ